MTAIELAKNGFTLHILGRNEVRGTQVLKDLNKISNDRPHKFYKVDLSRIKSNVEFLELYTKDHQSLDLLILSALAVPNTTQVTEDELELTFAVGYLSRYIFSILLNPLLINGNDARVIHLGDGFKANKFDKTKVYRIHSNTKETSLLQKFKFTFMAYSADAILTYHINQSIQENIPHAYYHPGFVNTNQLKEAPAFIKIIGSLFSPIIEPEKAAQLLTKHILTTNAQEVDRKYYFKGKLMRTSKRMEKSQFIYKELINFSKKLTNLEIK